MKRMTLEQAWKKRLSLGLKRIDFLFLAAAREDGKIGMPEVKSSIDARKKAPFVLGFFLALLILISTDFEKSTPITTVVSLICLVICVVSAVVLWLKRK